MEPATFRRDKAGGWLRELTEEWWRWSDLYLFPDHPSCVSFSLFNASQRQIRSALKRTCDVCARVCWSLRRTWKRFPVTGRWVPRWFQLPWEPDNPSRGRQETSSGFLPKLQLGRVKDSSFIYSLNHDQEAPGRPLISHWMQMSFYPAHSLLLLLLIFCFICMIWLDIPQKVTARGVLQEFNGGVSSRNCPVNTFNDLWRLFKLLYGCLKGLKEGGAFFPI